MGKLADFIFLSSKITADGDCSHEIKRRLLLGRKVMTNLDSIFKSRDITLWTLYPFSTFPNWAWSSKKNVQNSPALSCTFGFQKECPSSTFTTILKWSCHSVVGWGQGGIPLGERVVAGQAVLPFISSSKEQRATRGRAWDAVAWIVFPKPICGSPRVHGGYIWRQGFYGDNSV